MKSINELTDEWLNFLQKKQDKDALNLYCESIIPCLMPQLKGNFQATYGQSTKYNCLISLLGFTPETPILAYQFCEPDIFTVIHTKETAYLLDTVVCYSKVPQYAFFHEEFR